MSDATQQLIGANAAAAILGIPVRNGKPSGSVYEALSNLDCITVQLDGRAVKTWKRGDVEQLRHQLLTQQDTREAKPVGRESNFGQWQHRVKTLERETGDMAVVLADMVERSRKTLAKVDAIYDKVDRLLYIWEARE